jgi:hypothetical protein
VWTTAGYYSTALVSGVALTAGQDYFVAYLGNGSTGATIQCAGADFLLTNGSLTGLAQRSCQYNTGSQTSLPTSILGTNLINSNGIYTIGFLLQT